MRGPVRFRHNGFRRRWLRAAALASVLACVTLAVGCGSDTSSTATSATRGATTAAPPSEVQAVVDAANRFLGVLDDGQKKQAQRELTQDNAIKWSNFPCGEPCRGGVGFGSLTDEQLVAAKEVLQAAMGTGTGVGYDQAMKILMADDFLKGVADSQTAQGVPPADDALPGGFRHVGYSSGNYFLAVFGEPSMAGGWQLHFGGHHLAVNIAYRDGQTVGATPFFIGVEPLAWNGSDGITYAPLDIMREGMVKLTGSLTPEQLAEAKLSEAYTNVLLGPDQDGKFPQTKQGLTGSELSAEQKQLLMSAIRPWVAVVDDATAASVMAEYEKHLDDTYIGYSGGTNFTNLGDYVRIDGPAVWVEFVCQRSFEIPNTIHYHTIYRDRTRDYGGEFSF